MPTPFYHLRIAEDLLAHPALPAGVRDRLQPWRAAFLLGNTAPDVQTVTGQSRIATHFFDLPIRAGDPPAWENMLAHYPRLSQVERLSPDSAAFLAGYLCHLQADWMWVIDIFVPVFGPWLSWGTFPQRLYLHNVLRAYLDRQILPSLPGDIAGSLGQAAPLHWLPFVEDVFLFQWRDMLAGQLQPGAAVYTVEVFAARQGISPTEYYSMLDSEERLDNEIFGRLPRPAIQAYYQRLLTANLRLLSGLFQF